MPSILNNTTKTPVASSQKQNIIYLYGEEKEKKDSSLQDNLS